MVEKMSPSNKRPLNNKMFKLKPNEAFINNVCRFINTPQLGKIYNESNCTLKYVLECLDKDSFQSLCLVMKTHIYN